MSSVEVIAPDAATHELRTRALAVIGPDMKITGNVETTNKLLIAGEVLGEVRGSAVFVDKLGRITGGIVAEEVVVSGVVLGSIRGRHVILESSSHVEGDVFHEIFADRGGCRVPGKIAPFGKGESAARSCAVLQGRHLVQFIPYRIRHASSILSQRLGHLPSTTSRSSGPFEAVSRTSACGPSRHSLDVRFDGGYQGVSGRRADILGSSASDPKQTWRLPFVLATTLLMIWLLEAL